MYIWYTLYINQHQSSSIIINRHHSSSIIINPENPATKGNRAVCHFFRLKHLKLLCAAESATVSQDLEAICSPSPRWNRSVNLSDFIRLSWWFGPHPQTRCPTINMRHMIIMIIMIIMPCHIRKNCTALLIRQRMVLATSLRIVFYLPLGLFSPWAAIAAVLFLVCNRSSVLVRKHLWFIWFQGQKLFLSWSCNSLDGQLSILSQLSALFLSKQAGTTDIPHTRATLNLRSGVITGVERSSMRKLGYERPVAATVPTETCEFEDRSPGVVRENESLTEVYLAIILLILLQRSANHLNCAESPQSYSSLQGGSLEPG